MADHLDQSCHLEYGTIVKFPRNPFFISSRVWMADNLDHACHPEFFNNSKIS